MRLTSVLQQSDVEIKVSNTEKVEIDTEEGVGGRNEGEEGESRKKQVSEMHDGS
jgi:hypothetical protein